MSAATRESEITIPYRVRVGVVGPLALTCDDEGPFAQIVRETLNTVIPELFDKGSRKAFATATHTPMAFGVMTTLAGVLDRVVARAILEHPNARLNAVLPFPIEEYLQCFDSSDARGIEELLAQDPRPAVLGEGAPEGAAAATRELLVESYPEIATYIVDRSDVLITFSSDASAEGLAEAAEAVAYARERGRPVLTLSPVAPYPADCFRGVGLRARSLAGIERLNAFSMSEETQGSYLENLNNDLFDPAKPGGRLPAESKDLIRQNLLPFYVRASTIAKHNQKLYRRAGLLVYSLVPLAVTAVTLGVLFPATAPLAFLLELALLTAILVLVLWANRRRAHRNWLEARFLTERIRSGVFLAACGVEATPIMIPPYVGPAHEPDDWMLLAFREIWSRLPHLVPFQGSPCALFREFLQQHWIDDQLRFHENKAARSEKLSRRFERGGMAVFALAILAAALHVLPSLLGYEIHAAWWEDTLVLLAIVLPAAGASLGGLRAHREYSVLAKRSRSMSAGLEELRARAARADTPEELLAVVHDADELMLHETQEWLVLLKDRPLQPPA